MKTFLSLPWFMMSFILFIFNSLSSSFTSPKKASPTKPHHSYDDAPTNSLSLKALAWSDLNWLCNFHRYCLTHSHSFTQDSTFSSLSLCRTWQNSQNGNLPHSASLNSNPVLKECPGEWSIYNRLLDWNLTPISRIRWNDMSMLCLGCPGCCGLVKVIQIL